MLYTRVFEKPETRKQQKFIKQPLTTTSEDTNDDNSKRRAYYERNCYKWLKFTLKNKSSCRKYYSSTTQSEKDCEEAGNKPKSVLQLLISLCCGPPTVMAGFNLAMPLKTFLLLLSAVRFLNAPKTKQR